jgi:hypothetical protein
MSKIYVLHENDVWTEPLAAALDALGVAWESWFLDEGRVDLSAPPPDGIFYNRMSASSHTRGHRYAAELTQAVLNWLEAHGRRVVNSSRGLYLEVSKVAQYAALDRAGIRTPHTIAGVGRDAILRAAGELGTVPFIAKPNRGGKGAGVQLFNSVDSLAAMLDDPANEQPIDGIWLVQDYIRPTRPVITRCEFIGGKFLYAVEVDASQGFELCPADACEIGDAYCPTGAPVDKFRILEDFDDPILKRYAAFLAQNRIEVAGIEFVRDADGTPYTYDVNTNTNYNAAAETRDGRHGMTKLARFLGRELEKHDVGRRHEMVRGAELVAFG